MTTRGIGVAAAAALALFAGSARAELHAVRLDAENLEALRVRGPDAVAGLGDWALGNGTLCAVISDPAHENDLSETGGALMDLGRCGRADDQFLILEQLLDLSLQRLVPVESVVADRDAVEARVTARGRRDGLELSTEYAVRVAPRDRLFVRSVLTRRSEGKEVFATGFAFANVYALTPFVASTRIAEGGDPGAARGFRGTAFFGRGAGAASRAATPADLVVLVGDAALEPGVAYGAHLLRAQRVRADGEREDLPALVLADDLASIFAVFVRPFWLGSGERLGWPQLLQTRFMDLAVGETLVVDFEVLVGERADAASVTDAVYAEAPRVRGAVDDPEAALHVETADGDPVTFARPHPDGRFDFRVPEGDYVARIVAPGGREVSLPFAVRDDRDDTNLGQLFVGMPGRVRLPQGTPMRLVFEGREGTPDPRFGDDLLGYALEGQEEVRRTAGVPYVSLAGTAGDPGTVPLAPGYYRVWATRGPEYGVTRAELRVAPGQTTTLAIEPPVRAVETRGWVAADFHVHAAPSPDTALGLPARVRSYAAEGGEVLIATDHDMVTDYGPVIEELGLAGEMASLVGMEVTSEVETDTAPHTTGHANTFPVPRDPDAYRGGAVRNEGRRWRTILADLRALPGERVVQLNHARYDDGKQAPRAFFTHLAFVGEAYDPGLPLTAEPNRVLVEPDPDTGVRDIDFDAMELLNGKRMEGYYALREDWFSLLRQGEVLFGTANSDSHTLHHLVAVPRNYVRVDEDDPAALAPGAFVRAVREGRFFGTTGPFLDVRLGESRPGGTFAGAEGTLRIALRAAPWVPVEDVTVFVNGIPEVTLPVAAPADLEVPLFFERDAFVTVEAQGAPGEAYARVLPDFVPFAFSNPVFVDADADGAWTPPGNDGKDGSEGAPASE